MHYVQNFHLFNNLPFFHSYKKNALVVGNLEMSVFWKANEWQVLQNVKHYIQKHSEIDMNVFDYAYNWHIIIYRWSAVLKWWRGHWISMGEIKNRSTASARLQSHRQNLGLVSITLYSKFEGNCLLLTDTQMGGRTDGCYQVHYLPRFTVAPSPP